VTVETSFFVFDSCPPPAPSGTQVTITVTQTLTEPTANVDLLSRTGPDTVTLVIDGPQTQLAPEDIAGCYPAAGSDESPEEFLPHVALRRRTLPWERTGPALATPWLALLVLKESELARDTGDTGGGTLSHMKVADLAAIDPDTRAHLTTWLSDDADIHVAFVPTETLARVLPRTDELALLCHMKRQMTVEIDANGDRGDEVDDDCAIVIANRLPDAGEKEEKTERHVALLVSLEKRGDIYDRIKNPDLTGPTALVVVHHWTFTPSRGGDFEQVMRSVGVRPNGGVLRFGNLPSEPPQGAATPLSGGFDALLAHGGYPREPLEHTQSENAVYRGPLRPFPVTEPRSDGFAVRAAPEEFIDPQSDGALDFSHAAAFEIGRLLALHDPGIQDDLHALRRTIKIIKPDALISNIPAALQLPDWVSNPALSLEDPWSIGPNESLIRTNEALLDLVGEADVTGIGEQLGAQAAGILNEMDDMGTPVSSVPEMIDVGTMTAGGMDTSFPVVKTVGGN
jgi:hypothetical protein